MGVFFSLLVGGNATFPNLLNNFVHICMYFYYMMSAMGPNYAKFLWWKKYMTELQIVSNNEAFYYLWESFPISYRFERNRYAVCMDLDTRLASLFANISLTDCEQTA